MKLCGNSLPWVSGGKHLGNMVENKINGMQQDIKQKRAQYIAKNNDLIQEFSFAHPDSVLRMNQIYNTHFTGSPLWDLFSDAAVKLENTWNKSIRLMMNIPLETHRRLVQPLSGFLHIRKLLVKRFLKFVTQIRKSTKAVLRSLSQTVQNDARSTTWSNLRKILLQTDKDNVERLEVQDYSCIKYHELHESEAWKVGLAKELTDAKFGRVNIENMNIDEVCNTLDYICTS